MSDQVAEEWRSVVGYAGLYEVSRAGAVRSVERTVQQFHWRAQRDVAFVYRGRVLVPVPNNYGYATVSLSRAGKNVTSRVNVIVCIAFHGPRPDALEAAHRNGVRMDNRAENLYWATAAQQLDDKRRHGTFQSGEKNGRAKLTEEQVLYIRSSPKTQKALGLELGVARSTVQAAGSGTTWAAPRKRA